MVVNLTTPNMLTATDLYIGADALYVNMASRQLYKLNIFDELQGMEKGDYDVASRELNEFRVFELGEDNGIEVARLCELENKSEALNISGYSEVLVCVVFADCTI